MEGTKDIDSIRRGIAEYLGCDPDDVRGLALSVEFVNKENDTTNLTSIWSGYPVWHLMGFVRKLEHDLDQHDAKSQLEAMFSGGEPSDGQV